MAVPPPTGSAPLPWRFLAFGAAVIALAEPVYFHFQQSPRAVALHTAPAKIGSEFISDHANLRAFARSVAQRVVLLQPEETLPPHVVDREDRYGGWGTDDGERFPDRFIVPPEMLFEGAVRDVAAERGLDLAKARAMLREFAGRAQPGGEALDPALASFIQQDFAAAERHALAVSAACEQAEASRPAGGADPLLRVIADSGNKLRETITRQRAALLLAGDAQLLQSKSWEAWTSYRAAARLVSKTDTAPWLEAQWRVAIATSERGQHFAAIERWREITAVCAAKLGPSARQTLAAVIHLAVEWARTEREGLGGVQDYLAWLLAQRERSFGPEDADVARSLGLLSLDARQPARSSLAMEAFAIREKALGPDHPETLRALRRAAQAEESERLARRALAASERLYGPEHLEVAGALRFLAGVLPGQEGALEKDALLERALAIEEKRLGWDAPRVIDARRELADSRLLQDRPSNLEASLRRHVEEAQREFGPEHLRTASSLAVLAEFRTTLRQNDSALWRRVLAQCDTLLGDSPDEVAKLEDRVALLRLQRQALDAVFPERRARSGRGRAFGVPSAGGDCASVEGEGRSRGEPAGAGAS